MPIWQHSVLKRTSKSSEVQESATRQTPECCYHRPLLSNEHFAINTLSLLHPLQYFLSNFAHFLIPKCYSFPSGNEKNLFVVWMPVLFYQKLCVVFRGITTIQLFLAQQDVPGVGTKISINFEPFLVLDQWTTLCTCHAAIIRRDEFQEIQLIHVSCLCDPNAESHKMTFGNFSFLLFRWHFYEIIILVYKFRRKNMNHNSSHFL